MKLNEIAKERVTRKSVIEWLTQNAKCTSKTDIKVDSQTNGVYAPAGITILTAEKVPFKFDEISSWLNVNNQKMIDWSFLPRRVLELSMRNCGLKSIPKEVGEMQVRMYLDLADNELTSFENIPQDLQGINLTGNPITSLVDVHKHLKSVSFVKNGLVMDFERVTRGGIGLIQVENLRLLKHRFTYLSGSPIGVDSSENRLELPEPFKIIQKYLGRPADMFECQAELIENGFDKFAEM